VSIIELLIESPATFPAIVFFLSLLIGSFLNVVIYRLPLMMERDWREQCAEILEHDTPEKDDKFNLLVPRSRCSNCGALISPLQNVPVISYLILRGRCAHCSTQIGWRYPFVELFTAFSCTLVAYHFGFGWEAVAAIVLTYGLIALSGIDFDKQLLPDSIVLPLLWIGLLLSLASPQPQAMTLFVTPQNAIVGAVAGYLILWTVATLFKFATGRIGMGNGDFKLLALFGAWLGWEMLPLIILLSAGVGSVVGVTMIVFRGRDRQIPIPFGPYLAAAGWIAMLYGDRLMRSYLGLFTAN